MKLVAWIITGILFGCALGAFGQTHSSASLKQIVNAAPPIAASVLLASTPNPSTAGEKVTYSGSVTGSNNGASPTGTVTVVGATGSQTISLTAGGAYTCSETITKTGTYTITATYNGDSNFY